METRDSLRPWEARLQLRPAATLLSSPAKLKPGITSKGAMEPNEAAMEVRPLGHKGQGKAEKEGTVGKWT